MTPTASATLCPRRQRGGAAVEFALILTLLISVLAGIFGFGRAFWYYDAMAKATRDGARALSVSAKASIASQGVPAARQLVLDAVTRAGVPDFTSENIAVSCLDSSFNAALCADGVAPGGVKVQITGYTMSIGQYIPFLIGTTSSYSTPLAPQTTMRYML